MFNGGNATNLPPSIKVWRKPHKAFNSELSKKWGIAEKPKDERIKTGKYIKQKEINVEDDI